jgi:tetratricopeptide (TPR) repeat protein
MVIVAPRIAVAQPADPATVYQQALSRGYALFDKAKYAEARAEFEKAYQIQPKPLLLFNIASTYRRENNAKTALAYYRKFLEVAPKDHPQRRQADEAVAVLEERIDVERKQAVLREAAARPEPEPEPEPPAPRRGGALLWAGVATGLVGLAGLGWGVYQGSVAADRERDLEGLEPGSMWDAEKERWLSEGESAETQAIAFSVAGGVALAAGTTLAIIGLRRRAEPSEEVSIVPYGGESHAGVAVLGSF